MEQKKIPFDLQVSTREDSLHIEERLEEYTYSQAPTFADEEEEFSKKITDKDGNIIAGCNAIISRWGYVDVDILCVAEPYRRQGLGSALLKEVERVAKEKGCYFAMLGTFDFQARGLYEKHGYKLCVTIKNLFGHENYGMSKRLDIDVPTREFKKIEYEIQDGTEDDAETIENMLEEYNAPFFPEDEEYVKLNRKLLDKDGNIIAGIIAGYYTSGFAELFELWVEEPYRNQGLGSFLLENYEREIREKGIHQIFVEEYLYDWNIDFFKHRGYVPSGGFEDIPKGHCAYFDIEKEI